MVVVARVKHRADIVDESSRRIVHQLLAALALGNVFLKQRFHFGCLHRRKQSQMRLVFANSLIVLSVKMIAACQHQMNVGRHIAAQLICLLKKIDTLVLHRQIHIANANAVVEQRVVRVKLLCLKIILQSLVVVFLGVVRLTVFQVVVGLFKSVFLILKIVFVERNVLAKSRCAAGNGSYNYI